MRALLLASLFVTSLAHAEEYVPPAEPVAVVITSTPEGAAITVDGSAAGTAPLEVHLEPGAHSVEGSLEGHQSDQQRVDVPDETEVHLSLVPLPEAPATRLRPPPSALNYVLAGTFFAAGLAVATGPLITTIRVGDCSSSCDDPSEAERYTVGAQTISLLSVSAVLFTAAVVFALARPIRAQATFTRQSARLSLQASF